MVGHLKRVHREMELECTACHKRFWSSKSLQVHWVGSYMKNESSMVKKALNVKNLELRITKTVHFGGEPSPSISQSTADNRIKFIDTHVHLTVLEQKEWKVNNRECALVAGVDILHKPCLWEKGLAVARQSKTVKVAIGVHPHLVSSASHPINPDISNETLFERLVQEDTCVAIGETGLDVSQNMNTLSDQVKSLHFHMAMAYAYQKPVIMHLRGEQVACILGSVQAPIWKQMTTPIVIHSCSLSPASIMMIKELFNNVYFGISPVIFKDTQEGNNVKLLAQTMDFSRLLLETDSPYLGGRPYTVDLLDNILIRILHLRDIDLKHKREYAEILLKTSREVFKL